jgi:2-keto-4-pentenoate hydratase/2-oxohepta-3-ene-1,7-dioic acid hydratase in catechol pathway
MQIARSGNRLLLHDNGRYFEIEGVEDQYGFGVGSVLGQLDTLKRGVEVATPVALQAPFPCPTQIFAVGLNYKNHAAEMDLPLPVTPMVFAKFASCIADPNTDIYIPGETTDWEAELVIVVGRNGRNIDASEASSYIAGYMVGQDVSERTVQMASSPAQFSMGKSFENFAPMGPWFTSADEIHDPNDLLIQCSLNGELMQNESTEDMAFFVPQIIAFISSICELRAGDLIFTGSPAGVGQGQNPKRFLRDGDILTTSIEKLGSITNTFRRAT